MSGSTDRITVPTNGHHTPLTDDDVGSSTPPQASEAEDPAPIDLVSPPTPRIAVSPTQLAVGFGVIASLILLVLGRRRRGPGGR